MADLTADLGLSMPCNVIFTGVAGTGKTHRLQQLAKQYTDVVQSVNADQLGKTLVQTLSWRDVIVLVFLHKLQQGQELLKVADIVASPFFQYKAVVNNRQEHLEQTAWTTLRQHARSGSLSNHHPSTNHNPLTNHNPSNHQPSYQTPFNHNSQISGQAYFAKDSSSHWYLLSDSLPLLTDLQAQLDSYLASVANIHQREQCRYVMVSFHQAYGYDEFVEGIRPSVDADGKMHYDIQAGAFVRLCERAWQDPTHRYAVLIDEINRANVVQVFGELLSLIEPSKRMGQPHAMQVNLAYSGRLFGVPSNVDIYATMNVQDRSLMPLDTAFRRRFEFVLLLPNSQKLPCIDNPYDHKKIDLAKILDGLNTRLLQHAGEQALLGQAYFYGVDSVAGLITVMVKQVLPQLLNDLSQAQLIEVLNLSMVPWLLPITDIITTSASSNPVINQNKDVADAVGQYAGQSMNHMLSHGSSLHINPNMIRLLTKLPMAINPITNSTINPEQHNNPFLQSETWASLYD